MSRRPSKWLLTPCTSLRHDHCLPVPSSTIIHPKTSNSPISTLPPARETASPCPSSASQPSKAPIALQIKTELPGLTYRGQSDLFSLLLTRVLCAASLRAEQHAHVALLGDLCFTAWRPERLADLGCNQGPHLAGAWTWAPASSPWASASSSVRQLQQCRPPTVAARQNTWAFSCSLNNGY